MIICRKEHKTHAQRRAYMKCREILDGFLDLGSISFLRSSYISVPSFWKTALEVLQYIPLFDEAHITLSQSSTDFVWSFPSSYFWKQPAYSLVSFSSALYILVMTCPLWYPAHIGKADDPGQITYCNHLYPVICYRWPYDLSRAIQSPSLQFLKYEHWSRENLPPSLVCFQVGMV